MADEKLAAEEMGDGFKKKKLLEAPSQKKPTWEFEGFKDSSGGEDGDKNMNCEGDRGPSKDTSPSGTPFQPPSVLTTPKDFPLVTQTYHCGTPVGGGPNPQHQYRHYAHSPMSQSPMSGSLPTTTKYRSHSAAGASDNVVYRGNGAHGRGNGGGGGDGCPLFSPNSNGGGNNGHPYNRLLPSMNSLEGQESAQVTPMSNTKRHRRPVLVLDECDERSDTNLSPQFKVREENLDKTEDVNSRIFCAKESGRLAERLHEIDELCASLKKRCSTLEVQRNQVESELARVRDVYETQLLKSPTNKDNNEPRSLRERIAYLERQHQKDRTLLKKQDMELKSLRAELKAQTEHIESMRLHREHLEREIHNLEQTLEVAEYQGNKSPINSNDDRSLEMMSEVRSFESCMPPPSMVLAGGAMSARMKNREKDNVSSLDETPQKCEIVKVKPQPISSSSSSGLYILPTAALSAHNPALSFSGRNKLGRLPSATSSKYEGSPRSMVTSTKQLVAAPGSHHRSSSPGFSPRMDNRPMTPYAPIPLPFVSQILPPRGPLQSPLSPSAKHARDAASTSETCDTPSPPPMKASTDSSTPIVPRLDRLDNRSRFESEGQIRHLESLVASLIRDKQEMTKTVKMQEEMLRSMSRNTPFRAGVSPYPRTGAATCQSGVTSLVELDKKWAYGAENKMFKPMMRPRVPPFKMPDQTYHVPPQLSTGSSTPAICSGSRNITPLPTARGQMFSGQLNNPLLTSHRDSVPNLATAASGSAGSRGGVNSGQQQQQHHHHAVTTHSSLPRHFSRTKPLLETINSPLLGLQKSPRSSSPGGFRRLQADSPNVKSCSNIDFRAEKTSDSSPRTLSPCVTPRPTPRPFDAPPIGLFPSGKLQFSPLANALSSPYIHQSRRHRNINPRHSVPILHSHAYNNAAGGVVAGSMGTGPTAHMAASNPPFYVLPPAGTQNHNQRFFDQYGNQQQQQKGMVNKGDGTQQQRQQPHSSRNASQHQQHQHQQHHQDPASGSIAVCDTPSLVSTARAASLITDGEKEGDVGGMGGGGSITSNAIPSEASSITHGGEEREEETEIIRGEEEEPRTPMMRGGIAVREQEPMMRSEDHHPLPSDSQPYSTGQMTRSVPHIDRMNMGKACMKHTQVLEKSGSQLHMAPGFLKPNPVMSLPTQPPVFNFFA